VLKRFKDNNILCYLKGGSAQDRYRDKLLGIKPILKRQDKDADLICEANQEQVLALLTDLKPYKPQYIENLYQIIYNDPKLGKIHIDLRYNQNIKDLKNDAKKSYIGYFYADAEGLIQNPLGEKAFNALINNRFYCNFPLNTVFAGITGENGDMSPEESQAPLRILLYIYASTKRKLYFDDDLKRQIKLDKDLLNRQQITPGMINAKLNKLFLHKHALENFNLLEKFDLLSTLFPEIIHEINNDREWILEEMAAIDRQKKPLLYEVYANLIVSAVCQRLNLKTHINSYNEEFLKYLVLTNSADLISQSKLFNDLFHARVNIASFICRSFSWWKHEHFKEENPSLSLTMRK